MSSSHKNDINVGRIHVHHLKRNMFIRVPKNVCRKHLCFDDIQYGEKSQKPSLPVSKSYLRFYNILSFILLRQSYSWSGYVEQDVGFNLC